MNQPSGVVPIINLPGTGSLLSRSATAYSALFGKLAYVTLLFTVGTLVSFSLTSFFRYMAYTGPEAARVFLDIAILGISLIAGFYYSYVFAALIFLVHHWYTTGEALSVSDCLEYAKSRYISLFWVGVLYGFVVYGSFSTILLPLFFNARPFPVDTPSLYGIFRLYTASLELAALGALILPILFSVWYYFALYISILDNVRGIDALAKSRYLVHGVFFRVIGRYLAATSLFLAAIIAVYLLLAIPGVGAALFGIGFLALLFFAFSFFSVYEYMRFADLVAVERTNEFVAIRGERRSIAFWVCVGVFFSAVGMYSNLSNYSQQSAFEREQYIKHTASAITQGLVPIIRNINQNSQSFGQFLQKMYIGSQRQQEEE